MAHEIGVINKDNFLLELSRQFIGKTIESIDFDYVDGDPRLVVKVSGGESLRLEFDLNMCEGGYCAATVRANDVSLHFEDDLGDGRDRKGSEDHREKW